MKNLKTNIITFTKIRKINIRKNAYTHKHISETDPKLEKTGYIRKFLFHTHT